MTSNDAGPARYHVKPGRRRALLAALTGRGIDLGAERVTDRCPPQQAPVSARYKHADEVRLCCNSGSKDPHLPSCPVYTPGGYLRDLPKDGTRDCCPTLAGERHLLTCTLTPGQKAVMADHEAMGLPFEPLLARGDDTGTRGDFFCRGCSGRLVWRGPQLVHPEPLCEGMTEEKIAAIRYGLA